MKTTQDKDDLVRDLLAENERLKWKAGKGGRVKNPLKGFGSNAEAQRKSIETRRAKAKARKEAL